MQPEIVKSLRKNNCGILKLNLIIQNDFFTILENGIESTPNRKKLVANIEVSFSPNPDGRRDLNIFLKTKEGSLLGHILYGNIYLPGNDDEIKKAFRDEVIEMLS